MKKPYEIHVISNTHWDREWLNNFQETRMMLVEFFDRLLDVFEKEPGYHSYLLDSQAVPVEDYLEVRPERAETVARLVADKRLFVGPWYTAPECFCVNGESIVRNLLVGHRVARELGHVMKVGHTPFSYGQNSQMPQIYAGFGIDTILFYHGVSHDDTPNEFIFEGADGTRLFASQMSSGARYNFYHNIYRRVLYNEGIDDREYAWGEGGLPFHLCGEARHMGHHLQLDPRVAFHKECIKDSVLALRKAEMETETTRFLAFMDGHDSSLADAATIRIIEEAKKYLGADLIFHSCLPDLLEKVKKAATGLHVLKGERRVPKPMGARVHLYSDVLSCRTRMKRLNAHAELALQRAAEPFSAIAWALGAEYPRTLLDLAWKTLLKSHPHDSIAGTGVDDIELDMNNRLRQVINMADAATSRGLQHIQKRIDNGDAREDDVLLTVFNPSPHARTEVITAYLDVPRKGFDEISLVEADTKKPVAIQLAGRKPYQSVVNHAGNATMMMACDRVMVHLDAKDVPGIGYATYKVERKAAKRGKGLVTGANSMENEHLFVMIGNDGRLSVGPNGSDTTWWCPALNVFEDGGEAGHAWMHIEPAFDSVVTTLGQPARIMLEEDGPLLARYRIEHRMQIPVGLDENEGDAWKRLDGGPNMSRRIAETREMLVTSIVTLRRGARSLDVITRFENVCKNHRLRVLFATGIHAPKVHVESAFDVVERPIVHGPDSPWADAIKPTFPMQRFIDISDGKNGLAIINDGLREYEASIDDDDGMIALTLMRAFEVSLTTVSKRWERHPEMSLSQCPGAHEFRYRLMPHAGAWDKAGVLREAEALACPLEPAQAGAHGGDLPKRMALLGVEPAGLTLSALKQSEDGKGIVVRVANPSKKTVRGTLACFKKIVSAEEVTLEETRVRKLAPNGKTLPLSVGPKKIMTVKVTV